MSIRSQFLTPVEIPDGAYTGKWSGYELEFKHKGKPVFVKIGVGMRGNRSVRFRVADGQVAEESIGRER